MEDNKGHAYFVIALLLMLAAVGVMIAMAPKIWKIECPYP